MQFKERKSVNQRLFCFVFHQIRRSRRLIKINYMFDTYILRSKRKCALFDFKYFNIKQTYQFQLLHTIPPVYLSTTELRIYHVAWRDFLFIRLRSQFWYQTLCIKAFGKRTYENLQKLRSFFLELSINVDIFSSALTLGKCPRYSKFNW